MSNNVALYELFPKHLYDIKANFSVQVYQSEQEQTCTYEIPIENRTHRIELQKLYPWNEDLQAFTDFGDLSLRIHIGAEEQFGIQSVGELISRIFVFGMDSKIANQIPVTNTTRILGEVFGEEIAYKIAHLANYHEIDAKNLVENLVCSAYIEAENAGVVPVDPWKRNPNPEQILENEIQLWNLFPEVLRDLHITHNIDLEEDEGGKFMRITLVDDLAKTDSVDMYLRYQWDNEIQAYNQYLEPKLKITIWTDADEDISHWCILDRMKTLDQLFNVVFGMSINEFRYGRGYGY